MKIKISVLTDDYCKMIDTWCQDVIRSFYPMPCNKHFLMSILKKFWNMPGSDFDDLRSSFGIEYQFTSRLHTPEYKEINVEYLIYNDKICINWNGNITPIDMIDEILYVSASDQVVLMKQSRQLACSVFSIEE